MNKERIDDLLTKIDYYSKDKKLTKQEMAQILDVSYSTYMSWFSLGKNRKTPSSQNIQKIEKLISSSLRKANSCEELWAKILEWWNTQHRFKNVKELSDLIGWNEVSLWNCLQKKEKPPRIVVSKIAETAGLADESSEKNLHEAKKRSQKVKYILLLLEEELAWFRDTSKECRELFRLELNLNDIGYVSSLLNMLGEEESFKRWLALTTNRFNYFIKKRS